MRQSYSLGNCLRGYIYGHFETDEEAWNVLRVQFDLAFPSRAGREVELRRNTILQASTRHSYEEALADVTFTSSRVPPREKYVVLSG